MNAPYRAALDYLFPRTSQIKFGLETTHYLLEVVGNPHRQFEAVHIGGTNGKGSTATLVAEALRAAGHRVGLYTSPHLVSFRERVLVDGIPISPDAVTAWIDHLRPAIESHGATFFEATTALAFADFAARGVTIAVVEVGLGGRLDSTNVLTPLVSAVTHIAIDHQKYLGETLTEIAAEKAGIAKPGVPFVIGEPDPGLAALLESAGRRVTANRDYQPVMVSADQRWDGPLGLLGSHQRRNAAVAAAILGQLPRGLRPTTSECAAGFARARMPGRIDRQGKWLFDVAHNPDGMRTLVAALEELKVAGPVHAVVSILGDKAWPEMLVELDRGIDLGILTIAPSADSRRWELSWLERWLADPDRPRARAKWRLVPDFTEALGVAEQGAGTILVTGSFHTVGDVMRLKGVDVYFGP